MKLLRSLPLGRAFLAILLAATITLRLARPNAFDLLTSIRPDSVTVVLLLVLILVVLFPSLYKWALLTKRIQKRSFLIILCIALLVIKMSLPSISFDSNAIWLIAIITILFILPELRSLTPYIKKIKIGDTELELREKIEDLGKEVERAQSSAEADTESNASSEVAQMVSEETEKILQEASRNPQAALLLLSAKIEEQLRKRIEEAKITPPRTYSIIRFAELGVQNGIFPKDFLPAFRDFAAVRNQVAHGQAFNVDEAVVLSVISIGTELLKIASTPKPRIGLYSEPENES